MKENNYRVTYKNGTTRIFKAYSLELKEGKLYQCCKALVGDQGVPSVINGENIEKVELVENPVNFLLEWTAPFGPNKGERVSTWFSFGDPEIKRLKKEYNAIIIDMV